MATGGVVERIARQTAARRGVDYAGEVRRLLDAGLEVMRRCGTSSRPRVADIVAAAGLSNDAFYRHFESKDALVSAILEEGTERLAGYLEHQMAKETSPGGKLRRWVEGVLSQAVDPSIAASTLAVLWNAGGGGTKGVPDAVNSRAVLARLLTEPVAGLGSAHPELDAALITHATVGWLAQHLWDASRPGPTDVDAAVALFLRGIGGGEPTAGARPRSAGRRAEPSVRETDGRRGPTRPR